MADTIGGAVDRAAATLYERNQVFYGNPYGALRDTRAVIEAFLAELPAAADATEISREQIDRLIAQVRIA